ncbi:hypothetical protein [Burkholderia sp. 22PA0106]|uniref:hypothetical protein n=1 Tax=Burkholderia sp. 22PA0106 TaxID=3237371 RepID=UPI0039C16A68
MTLRPHRPRPASPTLDWIAPLLVPFTCVRLPRARGLWINANCPPPWPSDACRPDDDALERMAATWGFAAPDPHIFHPDALDWNASTRALAEPYGGAGSAGNGGGARVGILHDAQLKGIGRTPMLGRLVNIQHSYGALLLDQAFTEAIYSHLAQTLLPYGCAQIHGIVDTGVRAAFEDPVMRRWREGGATALMLREPCLRPAHFLRAEHFEPRDARAGVLDDPARVRLAHRALAALSRGTEGFETLMFDFLTRSARQFSAARTHRLIHGIVTPSNLAIDGRWLDLSFSSILPPGVNCKGGPASAAFLSEYRVPLVGVMELVYTFNKLHGHRIDTAQFTAHHHRIWERARVAATASCLGFSPERWRNRAAMSGAMQAITDAVHAVITGSGAIVAGFASVPLTQGSTFGSEDGLWHTVLALFGLRSGPRNDKLADAFAELLAMDLASTGADPSATLPGRTIARFIRISRPVWFDAFLFRPRIDELMHAATSDSADRAVGFLEDCLRLIDTIWSEREDKTVLVELPEARLEFDSASRRFELRSHGCRSRDLSAEQTARMLRDDFPNGLAWHGFDFLPGVMAILEQIPAMERRLSQHVGAAMVRNGP